MDQPGSCLCGCGQPVSDGRQWKRGHASRGEGGYAQQRGPGLLPGPDSEAWAEDAGIIDIDAGSSPGRPGDDGPPPPDDAPAPSGGGAPDEPPAHATRAWRQRGRGKPKKRPASVAPRITAAIRGDIDAKISFALEVPGRVWQARDPVCGSVFIDQRPEISAALTDIVCQSPDLVAWFTGPGGNFMLFLNLAAACWPVATVAMAHHVYHSIEAAEPGPADEIRYAA